MVVYHCTAVSFVSLRAYVITSLFDGCLLCSIFSSVDDGSDGFVPILDSFKSIMHEQ